ncbi:hypothetical protein MYA_4537 [Burkholderia sp. KJ006]|nr:hypothetical protein MYA_4537 [Burkholderia sp. KJ006]
MLNVDRAKTVRIRRRQPGNPRTPSASRIAAANCRAAPHLDP